MMGLAKSKLSTSSFSKETPTCQSEDAKNVTRPIIEQKENEKMSGMFKGIEAEGKFRGMHTLFIDGDVDTYDIKNEIEKIKENLKN